MERLILVAGATGYVGGRLVAALTEAGHRVRCLARDPAGLRGRIGPGSDVVHGDCLDPGSLTPALQGVHTAYYLVHSLRAGENFAALDRDAAEYFGRAARQAGVRRIIYLGGLGHGPEFSAHLRSRQETGALLRGSGVPVVEFRASIIIGAGSASFDMIRALVERVPVLVCPRWVSVPTQPIAIDDVVHYLVATLDLPAGNEGIFEIGGPDIVSYGDLMLEYARQRGLRRWLLPVPVLTPTLSSLWLGLVTPLHARVGRLLIDGVRTPTVVRSHTARRAFPIVPRTVRDAVARALRMDHDRRQRVLPAGSAARPAVRFVERHVRQVGASPAQAFAPVRRIGGDTGWYYGDWLWSLRGLVDRLAGGVGLRRARRDPETLRPGDTLDCWRVEAYEADRLLRLRAEMRLPGRAWLQFEMAPLGPGRCEVRQTAVFEPAGLAGRLYWYALYPVHALVFRGLVRGIVEQIGRMNERRTVQQDGPRPAPRAANWKTGRMEGSPMKTMDTIAAVLLIIGGLNWGLVALARFDLVAFITGAGPFGAVNGLGALIYGLVGLSAVYHAVRLPSMRTASEIPATHSARRVA